MLELGIRAVSANNSQPWQFAVVTGDALERLKAHNLKTLAGGSPPDRWEPAYPEPYLGRGRETVRQLFAAMGICESAGPGGPSVVSASLTPLP